MKAETIEAMQKAYAALWDELDVKGGRGVDLANAIDHLGAALDAAGIDRPQ